MDAIHHALSVEQILERQARFWQLRRPQEREKEGPGRGKCGGVYFGPYVLISREMGAGGRSVAALLGERLKWQVFDRQIVDEIARHVRIRQQLIGSLDEHVRGRLEEFIRDFLGEKILAPEGYLYGLRQTLLALGHQGNVVIVGRGAHYVLPMQFGLSVWMVAPVEIRIERVAKLEGITSEAARLLIAHIDAEREKFVHTHFQRRPRNPLDFDIVINTGYLTYEETAEILLGALRSKFGAPLHGIPAEVERYKSARGQTGPSESARKLSAGRCWPVAGRAA